MRKTLRSVIAAGAAAACAVTGLAACGGSDILSQARNGGPAPCPTTAGVDRASIDLGMLYSGSADNGDTSARFRAGVDARLGEVNAKGGINGRRLGYRIADDEGSPSLNAAGARILARDDDTLAVLQFSEASAGSAKVLSDAGMPVVDGQITDPGIASRANVFSYSRPLVSQPAPSGWGDFLNDRGARRVAVVSLQLSPGTQAMAHAAEQSVRAADLRVSTSLQVPAGPIDRQAFADQILAADADSLIAFVPAPTFYQLVRGVREAGLGLAAIIGGPTSYDRSQLAALGDKAAGVYAFLDYTPFEINAAAHRRFLTALATHAPQAAALPDGPALVGWISADLLLRGIAAAGVCPTRAGVLAGLRQQTHYDADGLLPAPINLSRGITAVTPCYDYVRVNPKGSAFSPVSATPKCGHVLPTQ
ncbi:ABC transporter substrate-binding protein [Frankia sp. AgKG'84/4]|uniref:ABC transporter substrate-binding protein n=1 Tax=Frankia sp. AgKG'84/4 TaxID=573490 RepID=UPI00200D6DCA|nr:ABC transporter substrate-binding protein [Frankia sp. AgKG'84/4]MCL9794596.1 ABC transporter substrate-binding protein [Frankia sp. AgKG'84/4]